MRAKGQGLVAVVTVAIVVIGGLVLDAVGARPPSPASPGVARSGTWLCPHGGGSGWQGDLTVANPGTEAVQVRVTPLGREGPGRPTLREVPSGTRIRVRLEPSEPGSATFVESFGGWVGAGWVVQGGDGDVGIGAEPCAPVGARRWLAAEGTTERGQEASVVVMNPYAADAVIDVALYSPTRAPVRDSELTDVVLRPGRSISIRSNDWLPGERVVAAEVVASVGRVAVASLGVGADGGIRSVLGSTVATDGASLPTVHAAGQGELVIFHPADRSVRFGATLLSRDPPEPAGGLTEQSQDAATARPYAVPIEGTGSVEVRTQDRARVAVALRVLGPGNDGAATGGAPAPATDWVVLPTVAGEPARPGLALVNPGNRAAQVELSLLAAEGDQVPAPVTVLVEPGSVATAPAGFLAAAPDAAVLVRSTQPVVALGASTSLGTKGRSVYGMSVGLTVPRGSLGDLP
jgi:hypothetical protein